MGHDLSFCMTDMDALSQILSSTLVEAVAPEISAFATRILGARRPLGVLFYGAGMRSNDPGALLDFYIIVDELNDWDWRNRLICLAGKYLPPNVIYMRQIIDGRLMRAKVAVMTIKQFIRLSGPRSYDSSIWSRFSQPSRLVWVRDTRAADHILSALRHAVLTSAWWAACLQPSPASPREIWCHLFSETYRNELRPEGSGRAESIIDGRDGWFESLLENAWLQLGLPISEIDNGKRFPKMPSMQRARARQKWRQMRRLGRWLNAARLIKAAFTFENGASYLSDKIRRHSGLEMNLSPYETRHPILCLPALLWRGRSILRRP